MVANGVKKQVHKNNPLRRAYMAIDAHKKIVENTMDMSRIPFSVDLILRFKGIMPDEPKNRLNHRFDLAAIAEIAHTFLFYPLVAETLAIEREGVHEIEKEIKADPDRAKRVHTVDLVIPYERFADFQAMQGISSVLGHITGGIAGVSANLSDNIHLFSDISGGPVADAEVTFMLNPDLHLWVRQCLDVFVTDLRESMAALLLNKADTALGYRKAWAVLTHEISRDSAARLTPYAAVDGYKYHREALRRGLAFRMPLKPRP